MEVKRKRKYDKSFKVETVKLILEQNRKVIDVSKDLGISTQVLYRWIREYQTFQEDAFPGQGNLRPEDEELRQLRRTVADLQEENAILKKAMAFFAKHPK